MNEEHDMLSQSTRPYPLLLVGRYKIVGLLGAGGMGTVYDAVDTRLGRAVAIKVPRMDRVECPSGLQQLRREVASMIRASGPRVCQVHDLFQWSGRPCVVLERLVGSTLQARMAAGRLPNDELLDVAEQLADALEDIHRAGLIHQDIKPANVFVTAAGVVKLLDFGLAEVSDPARARTEAGMRQGRPSVLGTTSYIAPERILRRPVDLRSDLFSLGAVLYEMA